MRYRIQKLTVSGFAHYEVIDTENNCETICTTKSYIDAQAFIQQKEASHEKHYAEIKWSWEDVHAVRPEWSEERCRSWWIGNQKWFREVLVEHGNEMLSDMLG